MGKRKAKRKPMKKLKDKLDVQFNCLFCNHENSIECKIDHPNKVGILNCKICDVNWQCPITYLDEPVDVYSGWIDACEELSRQKKLSASRSKERDRGRESSRSPPPQDEGLDPFDDDDDDAY